MKAAQIRLNIKAILIQLAIDDELPGDMTEFDSVLLSPAFYKGNKRYLTVDCSKGRRVYDTKKKKYIS